MTKTPVVSRKVVKLTDLLSRCLKCFPAWCIPSLIVKEKQPKNKKQICQLQQHLPLKQINQKPICQSFRRLRWYPMTCSPTEQRVRDSLDLSKISRSHSKWILCRLAIANSLLIKIKTFKVRGRCKAIQWNKLRFLILWMVSFSKNKRIRSRYKHRLKRQTTRCASLMSVLPRNRVLKKSQINSLSQWVSTNQNHFNSLNWSKKLTTHLRKYLRRSKSHQLIKTLDLKIQLPTCLLLSLKKSHNLSTSVELLTTSNS